LTVPDGSLGTFCIQARRAFLHLRATKPMQEMANASNTPINDRAE